MTRAISPGRARGATRLGIRWALFLGLLVGLLVAGPSAVDASMSVLGSSNGKECYFQARVSAGHSAAISVCRDALAFDSLSEKDRAATLVNLGIILTHAAKHPEALKAFDDAEEIRPGLTEAMINRGNTYFHQREFELAIEEYGRSLEAGTGRRAEAYVNRALAHEYRKDFPSAARDYACALAHRPEFAKAERGVSRVRNLGHEVPASCEDSVAAATP